MSRATVLVGFAEAMSAPEVVWSLVDGGFRVVAFGRKGRASAVRHSRHVECHDICPPEVNLQASLDGLHSLLTRLGNDNDGAQQILFPLDDKAVWLASRMNLDSRWLLAGPSGANAELALNKRDQLQMAREAGFNVPDTAVARTAYDVRNFTGTHPFPVILRAAECVPIRHGRVQSCGNWICDNTDELEHALAQWKENVPLLLQPYVVGTGAGVFGLAALGGVRAWSAHRRLRMMNPHGSGSSACISQSVPDDIKSTAESLMRAACWRGLFMIELLRDEAGKVWFVELNGRPWGSMALSRSQGLEYPSWHVELAMNDRSLAGMASSPEDGVVCRNIGREFVHLLFVMRGAKSKATRNFPSLWKTVGEVVRLHRRDAYYNWRSDDSKVFFTDCYYTIHDNLFKQGN